MNDEIKKLVSMGFAVFPVGRESKTPLVKWRKYAATTEGDSVALFAKHPTANVGIRLGQCECRHIGYFRQSLSHVIAKVAIRETNHCQYRTTGRTQGTQLR